MSEKKRFNKKSSGSSGSPRANIPVQLVEAFGGNKFSAKVLIDIPEIGLEADDVIQTVFPEDSRSKSLKAGYQLSLDKAQKGSDGSYSVPYSTRLATSKEVKEGAKAIETGWVSVTKNRDKDKYNVRVVNPEFAQVVTSKEDIVNFIGNILTDEYKNSGTPGFILLGREKNDASEEGIENSSDPESRVSRLFACYNEAVKEGETVKYVPKSPEAYYDAFVSGGENNNVSAILDAAFDKDSGWSFEIVPFTTYFTSPNFGGENSYDVSLPFKTFVKKEKDGVEEIKQYDGYSPGFVGVLITDSEGELRSKSGRSAFLAHASVPSLSGVRLADLATPNLDTPEMAGQKVAIENVYKTLEENRKAFWAAQKQNKEEENSTPPTP